MRLKGGGKMNSRRITPDDYPPRRILEVEENARHNERLQELEAHRINRQQPITQTTANFVENNTEPLTEYLYNSRNINQSIPLHYLWDEYRLYLNNNRSRMNDYLHALVDDFVTGDGINRIDYQMLMRNYNNFLANRQRQQNQEISDRLNGTIRNNAEDHFDINNHFAILDNQLERNSDSNSDDQLIFFNDFFDDDSISGSGLKKKRKSRFEKGSQEAKNYMKALRDKRQKK